MLRLRPRTPARPPHSTPRSAGHIRIGAIAGVVRQPKLARGEVARIANLPSRARRAGGVRSSATTRSMGLRSRITHLAARGLRQVERSAARQERRDQRQVANRGRRGEGRRLPFADGSLSSRRRDPGPASRPAGTASATGSSSALGPKSSERRAIVSVGRDFPVFLHPDPRGIRAGAPGAQGRTRLSGLHDRILTRRHPGRGSAAARPHDQCHGRAGHR